MKLVALRRIFDSVGTIEEGARFHAGDTVGSDMIAVGSAVEVGKHAFADGRWAGATVVIIASGPSLSARDCEDVRAWREAGGDRRVIVINSSYVLTPWADVLYACDAAWWRENGAAVREVFHGERWAQGDDDGGHAEHLIASKALAGLSRKPGVIYQGGNSGYQAINLAYQLGAAKIVLTGFDMQAEGRQKHWHPPHPAHVATYHDYTGWKDAFAPLAADLLEDGVEVVNATRRTALTCFPCAPLADALGLPLAAEVVDEPVRPVAAAGNVGPVEEPAQPELPVAEDASAAPNPAPATQRVKHGKRR